MALEIVAEDLDGHEGIAVPGFLAPPALVLASVWPLVFWPVLLAWLELPALLVRVG